MLNTFILKNGLKVATYSLPEMKSAFVALSVNAGSIFDTEDTSGTAHFMEHILFEGTPSFGDMQSLQRIIENMAGNFNASTGSEMIRFNITGPFNRIEDLLKIASEVFFEPLFPEKGIEKERGVVLEEIKQRQDNLWYKNTRFFCKVRYKPGHPQILDGGGLEKVVKKLKRSDLINYWSRFFYPNNAYLVVAGGFKSKTVQAFIENCFEKYKPGPEFLGYPALTEEDFSDRTVAIRQDNELRTCYLDLTFPCVKLKFPLQDRVVLSVVRRIIGGLGSSRLYKLLRHERGLVYDVSCSATSFTNFGYFYISAQVAVEKLEEVILLIVKELSSFYLNGATKEELELAKNYNINSGYMAFDHPSAIADWIEEDLVEEDKVYLPEEYEEMIKKVTNDDILMVIKKYWDFSKLNLVVQGPFKNSKSNIGKITNLISSLK